MDVNRVAESGDQAPWSQLNEVSLRDYFRVVHRAKWWILIFSGAVSLMVALMVFSMTPIYQGKAIVMIEPQAERLISIEDVYAPDSHSREYFQTQYEILKSRPLAEHVINELSLLNSPQENSLIHDSLLSSWLPWLTIDTWLSKFGHIEIAPVEVNRRNDSMQLASTAYAENLKVAPIPNTQLIEIAFNSPDAEQAAAVANAHANAYIQSILDAKFSFTQSATKWMSDRVDSLKRNLDKSEKQLQAFREKEQLVDTQGLLHLSTLELNELTTKLVDAQREKSVASNAFQQVAQLEHLSPGNFDSIPAVLNDPLAQKIRSQQSITQQKLAELKKRYGPLHPRMLAAQEELTSVSNNLSRHIKNVIKGISKKYDVAIAHESGLKNAIEKATQQYHAVGRKQSKLLSLQQEVDVNRELYKLFHQRMKETTVTGSLQSANARITSPAVIPLDPIKPQKGLIITLIFVVSAIVGVITAFVRDAFDNSLTNIADVARKLRYPLFGVVPLLKQYDKQQLISYSTVNNAEKRRFSEAVRTVRTAILLNEKTKLTKTVLVTSTLSSEGKSTLALNLAYELGKMESVVLVECDMRRPVLVKALKLSKDTPGLSEIFAGKATCSECLLQQENIDVLVAGSYVLDPLTLFGSALFEQLLKNLRLKYDRVIIDSSPVLSVSDAVVLSSYSDLAIYVVGAGSTPQRQIKIGLERLARVNDLQITIVVNGLDTRKAEKYGDYHDYFDELYEPLNAVAT